MRKTDLELLKLMKESAEEKCEYAIGKWMNGEYLMDNDENRKSINEWKDRKNQIDELYQTLKDYITKNII